MSGDWATVKEIVCTALEMNSEEREAYLDESCSNPAVRAEVDQLLASHGEGAVFFARLEEGLGSSGLELNCLAEGDIVAERYEIRAFLAQGGSGEVYEAWDREIRERVALKVLRPRVSSEQAIEQFRQEVRLSRKIKHEHVCKIHDVGRFLRFDGLPVLFLSMEMLEGETLAARLRRCGKQEVRECRTILRQIASGLEAAHDEGILHRDLKSSNVILARDSDGKEHAVLTDFGLATSAEGDGAESIVGTPAYMAPEQVMGLVLTPAADIYSLGVVAFEMATGRLPFSGESPMEQARTRLTQNPPAPSSLNPEIDWRLEKAILRCLERDPIKRFSGAREMVEALDRSYVKPVAAALLLLAAAGGMGGWWAHDKALNEAPFEHSVVVAGFEASEEKDKTEAEAFREELISELAEVPGIRVVAQTTSGRIALTAQGLKRVRRELRTVSVLAGSIRPEPEPGLPEQTRVAAQLLDTDSGTVLWSGSYKALPRDLPQIQEKVVLAGVGGLHVALAPPEIQASSARHSKSVVAYQAYLLGHYFAGRRNTADLKQSLDFYRTAVAADSGYGTAWAGMAATFTLIANRGVMPAAEAFHLSEDAADRALVLDRHLAEAWLVKGINAHHAFWKWDEAEKDFRTGIELAPGLGVGHHWLAGLLSERGRHDEALKEAEIALQLDPLSTSVNGAYAAFLYRARRYREAAERYESLLRQQPAFVGAKLGLAHVYVQLGRMNEAVVLAESVVSATEQASFALAELGFLYGRAGRDVDARGVLTELEARHQSGKALASELAQVYNGLADVSDTVRLLEEGFGTRDEELRVIRTDPAYDGLRSDRRFAELVARVGQ